MAQVVWHSSKAPDFIKEFHKIYKQIAAPLDLMLSYRAYGIETNAMLQLQHDMQILVELLIDYWSTDSRDGWCTNSRGETSIDRTAFLFEMAEFSLGPQEWRVQTLFEDAKRPKCGMKLNEHVSHYKEQHGAGTPKHVNGLTLEMLREFDDTKKTKHCSAWKNYLQKITENAFLTGVGYDVLLFPPANYKEDRAKTLPGDEQELRAQLLESYEQAATGGRSGNFSHPLGQDMDAAIRKFIVSANQGWRILQNREERFRSHDSQNTFNSEAMTLASTVMKLDQAPQEKAIQLLWDIAPSLGLYGYKPAELIEGVQQESNNQAIFEQLPDTVKMMDLVQEVTKAKEGHLARHTLFNLVVCFCKADGVVSKEEEKLLKIFANTLFGKNESVTVDLGLFSSTKPSLETPKLRITEETKSDQEKSETLDSPKQKTAEETLDTPKVVIGGELSTDRSIAELAVLVGLETVKDDVQQLVNFTRIQQVRRSRAMKMVPATRHMLFYGNPGTGKTTVARLISQIYKDLGVVSKGHLVECDRSGLVGAYAGHTAIKVSEVVTAAVGGVLFIDEAYSLNQGDNDSYGLEAINTLVKLMEDNRDDLVVIAAGYPQKMANFVSSNPGLRSRFNRVFSFDDYNPEQLLEIFLCMAKGSGYQVAEDASESLAELFQQMYKARDASFGNGRDVRNVFEAAMAEQANRLVTQPDVTADTLSQITLMDVSNLTDAASFKSSKPTSAFGFQATRT